MINFQLRAKINGVKFLLIIKCFLSSNSIEVAKIEGAKLGLNTQKEIITRNIIFSRKQTH